MKVAALLGPESTGKSWLARQLHARFGGEVVDEYVRAYVATLGRETTLADVTLIAQGQVAAEDAARAREPALLLLDTHLLSNRLWSMALFGECPAWLEAHVLARHYDVTLVLSPEGVPWLADGQRCQPVLAERMAFFDATVAWLEQHRQRYHIIEGDWPARDYAARQHIGALLAS